MNARSTFPRRSARRRGRGMTLLEVLVSLGVLAMISLLIYGALDSLSRGRKGESLRVDRARQGRDAMDRMQREIASAFLSMHNPANQSLITRQTCFLATNGGTFDRIDFVSFAHRRVTADSKESDQAEIGYFVVKDPDHDDKMDLVRREQPNPDYEPKAGGVVNVLAEDVESFDLRFLDPLSGQWIETWDSVQLTAQLNRLPVEVKITLVLKPVKNSPPFRFITKFMMPMQQPLSFGIPR
ncbi:MAG: ral secretion pathway protein [Labilithrix sp.]|nr:ral secretion pathway protein [Labilithrix sp.]